MLVSIKKRFKNANKQCVVDTCLILVANYSGKTLKFVAEQEGWKKPGEDLVKTIWAGI
jgi:hypothetical protein